MSKQVAILFAVPQEVAPLARRLQPLDGSSPSLPSCASLPRQAHGLQLLLVEGGMGAKRAARAAGEILQSWTPDLLVVAGVAGALSPSLQIGDVVVADAVYAGDEALRPPVILQPPTQAHIGPFLSTDRVLISAQEKRAAVGSRQWSVVSEQASTPQQPNTPTPNTQHPTPIAVEMETAAAARVAEAHGVPWAAVRAISDTAGESLPLDFNRLRGPDGDLSTGRVALAALARPGSIPGLLRLGRNTARAAEALACFLDEWLATMGKDAG